jgi:hypothetical protein
VDACVLEMIVVLIRRYMQMERQALAQGEHAHVMIFSSLFYLYGLARISICSRTTIGHIEVPDLEPLLTRLPSDMQTAIRGAIAAEQAGRVCGECDDCLHRELPTDFHQNVLESHYIWMIEKPLFKLPSLPAVSAAAQHWLNWCLGGGRQLPQ